MKVDKLFNVLVVGGAMMAGCAGTPSTPDKMPVGQPPAPAEAPASPDEAQPADDAAKPAEEGEKKDGDDGTCAWF